MGEGLFQILRSLFVICRENKLLLDENFSFYDRSNGAYESGTAMGSV